MKQTTPQGGVAARQGRFESVVAGIARLAGTLYPLLVVTSVGVVCWRIAA